LTRTQKQNTAQRGAARSCLEAKRAAHWPHTLMKEQELKQAPRGRSAQLLQAERRSPLAATLQERAREA